MSGEIFWHESHPEASKMFFFPLHYSRAVLKVLQYLYKHLFTITQYWTLVTTKM